MSDIRIVFVVAVAENGVIGYEGGLPWRQSSDLKLFRKLTMGKPLIMGRRTFQSIGKPLDGRDNIVITRDPSFTAAGVSICGSVPEALTLARVLATTRGADEIAVIGGAEIYDAFLPDADRIYLTRVHAEPVGDKYFAPLDPVLWRETSREPLPKGERDQFETTLIVYDRDKGAGQ